LAAEFKGTFIRAIRKTGIPKHMVPHSCSTSQYAQILLLMMIIQMSVYQIGQIMALSGGAQIKIDLRSYPHDLGTDV
jgi:hypothetical protein